MLAKCNLLRAILVTFDVRLLKPATTTNITKISDCKAKVTNSDKARTLSRSGAEIEDPKREE
jgi:hypothetical protein